MTSRQWSKPAARTKGTIQITISLGFILTVILLGLFPLVANSFLLVQVGAQASILGIIALSLMILGGWGGMVTLSQMTIAGLASYIVAIAGVNSAGIGLGWPWYIVAPMAIVGGTIVATLIGIVSARTEGIHTIMITLALGVAFFYFTLQNYSVFNGFTGYADINAPVIFGLNLREPVPFYYLCVGVALIAYLVAIRLERTPFGLILKGLRDNNQRMSAIGFDTYRHRVLAHVLAGVFASVGGVLFVWFNLRVSPGTIAVGPLLNILIIAVIGGLRNPAGPFIGAVFFILLKTFAIDFVDPNRFNTLIGSIFIAVVLFSPDGLLGLLRMFTRPNLKSKPRMWKTKPHQNETETQTEDYQ